MMIEEGKFYKTRDGRKVGPMARSGDGWRDGQTWQFDTKGNRWEGCPQIWGHNGDVKMPEEPWDEVDALIAEWTEGPVRTVTRREVVPGFYHGIYVGEANHMTGSVQLRINEAYYGADTLKAAAAVLLELAGALDA